MIFLFFSRRNNIAEISGQLEIQRVLRADFHLLKNDFRFGLIDSSMQIKSQRIRIIAVKNTDRIFFGQLVYAV